MRRIILVIIFQILQLIFLTLNYKLMSNLDIEKRNEAIMLLSLLVPFQIFGMGMNNYILRNGKTDYDRLYFDCLLIVIFFSSIGGLLIMIGGLIIGILWQDAFFVAILLILNNLSLYLNNLYDSTGRSNMRLWIGSALTIFSSIGVFLFGRYTLSINPIFWNLIYTAVIVIVLIVNGKVFFKTDKYNRARLLEILVYIKSGFQFNLMNLPTFTYEFIIKLAISSFNPQGLFAFDIINKFIQQIGGFLMTLNQTWVAKIRDPQAEYSALRIDSYNIILYFLATSFLFLILDRILEFFKIDLSHDYIEVYMILMVGWMFNTLSINSYYFNLVRGRVQRNIIGNFSMLLVLVFLILTGSFFQIPLYYSWTAALFTSAVIVIGNDRLRLLFQLDNLRNIVFYALMPVVILIASEFLNYDLLRILTVLLIALCLRPFLKLSKSFFGESI